MFRKLFFLTVTLFIGAVIGFCIKVYMVRGAPITHAGGELLMLLAVPLLIYAGYQLKKAEVIMRDNFGSK